MDDQKAMKKRLKVLMNKPENQVCSDCSEKSPRWASLIVPPPGAPQGSLPIGAFCCLECSGSHRRLGVHISFVRSINLDSWKEKEVLAMENGGNAKVNAIFEANLTDPGVKPTNLADLNTRERFIRDKYERRKYYDASVFQRLEAEASAAAAAPPPAPSPSKRQHDIVLPALSGSGISNSSSKSVGPPSDAARQRLEERRSRNPPSRNGSGNASRQRKGSTSPLPSRSSSVERRAFHRAPASAPVDLLDFSSDPAHTNNGNKVDMFAHTRKEQTLSHKAASFGPGDEGSGELFDFLAHRQQGGGFDLNPSMEMVLPEDEMKQQQTQQHKTSTEQQPAQTHALKPPPERGVSRNSSLQRSKQREEILSLYNSNSNNTQNMAGGGLGNTAPMANNNNNPGNLNAMMQQMNLGMSGMNPQQQAMMMQQMMLLQQQILMQQGMPAHGNQNMHGNHNMMMNPMQQQQPMMAMPGGGNNAGFGMAPMGGTGGGSGLSSNDWNTNNMNAFMSGNHSGGGSGSSASVGGNSTSTSRSGKQSRRRSKASGDDNKSDPFAQFGTNPFRS